MPQPKSLKKCKECGESYNSQHIKHKGGHLGICGDCEDKETLRIPSPIGVIEATGPDGVTIGIIENPTPEQVRLVEDWGKKAD